jgi:hypothetical protein
VSTSPRTPAECFAGIILWLGRAVDAQSMWGRFSRPLALLILNRIREINQRFARTAARVGAGTYVPRRRASAHRPAGPHPRRKNPLPQGAAWLLKLLPETASYGSQLQFLLADPAMAALLAAAPASLRRPVRSLCHMLGVAPPAILAPILALPARTPPPAPPPAPAARRPAAKPLPARPPPPRPAPAPAPPARACGPPRPA